QSSRPFSQDGRGCAPFVERVSGGCGASGGQGIQPSPGSVLTSRRRRVFPAALEESHFFEAAERAVQRSVCGEQSSIRCATKHFGQFVAMKRLLAALAEPQCRLAN